MDRGRNLPLHRTDVDGGRGASAQADWDAGKMLQLPDARGRSAIGAGAGAGLTLNLPLGGLGGEEKHTLSLNEMPPHSHGARYTQDANQFNDNNPNGVAMLDTSSNVGTSNSLILSNGGGQPFNVVHPVFAVNWQIKYGTPP